MYVFVKALNHESNLFVIVFIEHTLQHLFWLGKLGIVGNGK